VPLEKFAMRFRFGRARAAEQSGAPAPPQPNGSSAMLADPEELASKDARIAELEAEVDLYRGIFIRVVKVTSEAAQGNLEARLLRCDQSEQLREIARSVNHLLDMTDAFLREVGAALDHASQGKYFRRVLLRGMRGTFRHKSQLINEAMEKMARNASSVTDVQRLVQESAGVAQAAVREAGQATEVVRLLGEAFQRIASVVKSITEVAWQTRLLAFNAQIEAAQAGDAGRGFEVVAQEVKHLAQQTAGATDDIAREINSVRQAVERTESAIDTMNKTITRMQQISAEIERAVVDQGRSESDVFANAAAPEARR
jgi:methyl-accepting chemotaxis protein